MILENFENLDLCSSGSESWTRAQETPSEIAKTESTDLSLQVYFQLHPGHTAVEINV